MSYHPHIAESPPQRSMRDTISAAHNQSIPVFTAADCEAQLNELAAVNCPILQSTWQSMGIDDSSVHLLMFELYEHINQVFQRTIKEANEEMERLTKLLTRLMDEIPQLAREVDDSTANNELAACSESMGLRDRAEIAQSIVDRLLDRKAQASQYITQAIKEISQLYRELGNEATQDQSLMVQSSDFSMTKCERLRAELTRLHDIQLTLTQALNACANQCLSLCSELDVIPDDFTLALAKPDFHLDDAAIKLAMKQSSLPITYSTLRHSLDSRVERLNALKEHNILECNKLMSEIHSLWVRLQIPAHIQQNFLTQVTSSVSNSVVKKMERELAELQAIKQSKMIELINRVREQIATWANKLGYSEQQIQHLTRANDPMFVNAMQSSGQTPTNQHKQVDDAMLEEFERELEGLKRQYEEYAPILKLVAKRDKYKHDLAEHAISQSLAASADRLVTRKPNFAVLKEEERIRNIESKWLPKTEDELLRALHSWENDHARPFMWNGERLIDAIHASIEEAKEIAAAKRRAAEEARGKNAERNSVYGRKPEGQRGEPVSASKSRTNITTPARTKTQTTVSRSLNQTINQAPSLNTSICSNASTASMYRKPPQGPFFESQIPNLPLSSRLNMYAGQTVHQSIHQSPVRPISRTTPCKMTPSRLPIRQANKENSSL